MKVLWVGDTPTVSTGFARCTRAACAALHSAGHEVLVLGINENGDPHNYPYRIFPAKGNGRFDGMGTRRLPTLVVQERPDVIVLLQDPWNVHDYLEQINESGVAGLPPIVGWLAVDARNHPHSHELNQLEHVVTWTQFAIDELRLGGYTEEASIVPLGVDTSVYHPLTRAECRAQVLPVNFDPDAFIVGVVGRNQPRKRLDLAIGYFAEFIKQNNITNAHLYLHVAPTGERACDIRAVASYYGPELVGKIIVSSNPGGLAEAGMPLVYGSFDVCLTTTQGEGWGLTTHEAMACGVPCIVPDWSALGEWPGDAVMKVPCTSTALNAPLDFHPYTIGGVPDRAATVKALWKMYAYRQVREEYRERGLELAARPELQAAAVGEAFRLGLEGVLVRAGSPVGASQSAGGSNPHPHGEKDPGGPVAATPGGVTAVAAAPVAAGEGG